MLNHNYVSVQYDFFWKFSSKFYQNIAKKGEKGIRPRRDSNPGHLWEPLSDPSEIWLKLTIANFWPWVQ